MIFQTILLAIILVWLLVCMVYDLRSRQVPMKLTLAALVFAGIYALFQKEWVPVLLTSSLILISDVEPRPRRLSLAAVFSIFAPLFDPTCLVQVIVIFTAWLLWDMGAMGGADAKLLMVLCLSLGQPFVFVWIALAGGFQGLLAILARKKSIPYVAAIFAGTSLYAIHFWVSYIF